MGINTTKSAFYPFVIPNYAERLKAAHPRILECAHKVYPLNSLSLQEFTKEFGSQCVDSYVSMSIYNAFKYYNDKITFLLSLDEIYLVLAISSVGTEEEKARFCYFIINTGDNKESVLKQDIEYFCRRMGCESKDPIFNAISLLNFSISLDEFIQLYHTHKLSMPFQCIETFTTPYSEICEAGLVKEDMSYSIDNDVKRLAQIYDLDLIEAATLHQLKKKVAYLYSDKSKIHKKITKTLNQMQIPFKQLQISHILKDKVEWTY